MKKEDLRKVKYTVNKPVAYFATPAEKEDKFKSGIGLFHYWQKIVHENGSEQMWATVEDEKGFMISVEPDRLQFIDK